MAQVQDIILTKPNQLNQIKISTNVVEVILSIAAKDIEGVASMHGNLSSNFNELFGLKDKTKGVNIDSINGELIADVYVIFEYGVSVPEVASQIQTVLKEQLYFMTELKLKKVNVHVDGVVTKKIDETKETGDA